MRGLYNMLPNFICPGSAKSATTTLFDILKDHSDIYLPSVKETNFFAYEHLYAKGLKWYEKEFYPSTKGKKVIGDISTGYMQYAPVAANRIKEVLGSDVKFVFLLRNPVDRAYSHYCMIRYNNDKPEPEFDSIINNIVKMEIKLNHKDYIELSKGYRHICHEDMNKWRYMTYLHNGFYSKIIREYLKHFPINNMKFILFENFIKDPKKTVKKVLKFLNIDENLELDYFKKVNSSGIVKNYRINDILHQIANNKVLSSVLYKLLGHKNVIKGYYYIKNKNRAKHKPPKINETTILKLKEFYHKDICELENLINTDLSNWK